MQLRQIGPTGIVYYIALRACTLGMRPELVQAVIRGLLRWVPKLLSGVGEASNTDDLTRSWHVASDLDLMHSLNCLGHRILSAYRRAILDEVEQKLSSLRERHANQPFTNRLTRVQDAVLDQQHGLGSYYTRCSLAQFSSEGVNHCWAGLAGPRLAIILAPSPSDSAEGTIIPKHVNKRSVMVWLDFKLLCNGRLFEEPIKCTEIVVRYGGEDKSAMENMHWEAAFRLLEEANSTMLMLDAGSYNIVVRSCAHSSQHTQALQ